MCARCQILHLIGDKLLSTATFYKTHGGSHLNTCVLQVFQPIVWVGSIGANVVMCSSLAPIRGLEHI